MIRKCVVIIMCLLPLTMYAQEKILDVYINQALESNITLQQKKYSYEKSLEALKESKRMFLPTLSFNASYTQAQGGRTVSIPVGDMMNPLYSNLNVVNQTLQQSVSGYPELSAYPEIDDYTLSFVREKEQETKLTLSMPVFNAVIIQNHKINKGLVDVEQINVQVYKRELVKEVKTAYYQYLKAERALVLYNNSLEIVNQNLRSRQSLYDNDKITIDELYAAKAQVNEMEKNIAEAKKNQIMAKAWFNFLLNTDFNADIDYEAENEMEVLSISLEESQSLSVEKREELIRLDKYVEIQSNKVKLEQGKYLPEIGIGAQYGYQGTEYNFASDYDLAAVGITLKWNIFSSGQQKAKVQQARIDQQVASSKKIEAERQIQLQVINTWYTIQTNQKGIDLAEQELLNYEKSYQLVEKKYQHGMANYLEFSNALNNKINAENKLIIAQYDYLIGQVKLERMIAGYQF